MTHEFISIYSPSYSSVCLPLENPTVMLIVELITTKEEYEAHLTPASFVRYETAKIRLRNDDEARAIMIAAALIGRSILGD